MTDEEIICTFMEPLRDKWALPKWWHWAGGKRKLRDLGLDALREVQARLTDEQWATYESQFNSASTWRQLLHASTEQKIKALAAVLRPSMEAAQKAAV